MLIQFESELTSQVTNTQDLEHRIVNAEQLAGIFFNYSPQSTPATFRNESLIMKTQIWTTSSIRQSIPCYIIMLSCYNWKIISQILHRLFHLKIQSVFKMFHTFQYFQHLYLAPHKCREFQINFVNDLEENIIQFHRTLWLRIPDRMPNYIDKGWEKQYLRFNMLKVAFILVLLLTL
jgi:hypothetical protein